MLSQKAHSLGVRGEDVKVATFHGKYGGAWVAYVPDEERGRRVLHQSYDLFAMCKWRADLIALDKQP